MADKRTNMSCARVKSYTAAKAGSAERHNERKNNDYGNVNVDPERIPLNIHFKAPGDKSYMDILREMESAGKVSRRGLKADARLFDELVFDVNTMYFEERGGYEYARDFYEEAYHYTCEKYGEDYVLSAVMHADEVNLAATEEMGHPVYHYHLHVIALPVVEKEIHWSKRCKDPALVGTVKEVIHQISHSKKWESREPLLDAEGNPVLRSNGKLKYRASYSILQDEFYKHMKEHGYEGFERGREGSTAEHLSSLQYQIEKDKERLSEINEKLRSAELEYEPALEMNKTYQEIDEAGKKTITGKFSVSSDDYEQLTALAKEGITSRKKIKELEEDVSFYRHSTNQYRNAFTDLKEQYEGIMEKCRPFLYALEHFPETAKQFVDTVRGLFNNKESSEKTALEQAQQERKQKNLGWDR